jgi:hypothetical protein
MRNRVVDVALRQVRALPRLPGRGCRAATDVATKAARTFDRQLCGPDEAQRVSHLGRARSRSRRGAANATRPDGALRPLIRERLHGLFETTRQKIATISNGCELFAVVEDLGADGRLSDAGHSLILVGETSELIGSLHVH